MIGLGNVMTGKTPNRSMIQSVENNRDNPVFVVDCLDLDQSGTSLVSIPANIIYRSSENRLN